MLGAEGSGSPTLTAGCDPALGSPALAFRKVGDL